ncbi:protein Niban 2-like [Myxocyprinus asiaticus]|uniref:protein Niban 2-like n=1 Tax=Myxocyprinus asiaticus TaxID=70543 RepID=UPI0022228F94|nr:protein Niban 2-like [Myxocyprinus asiaticus]
MGDVISTNLDEGKREMITARTSAVMAEFGTIHEQQYTVALFNSVRFEIEGGGNTQTQLLQRKDPLKNKSIFSGGLFQYLEESKKWRSRFLYVGDSYNIGLYESKAAHDRGLHPKGIINCAGYRALTSMEEYLELLNNSLPDTKAKAGNSPFLKCPTQFPLILWHPYARHHYFCVMTEKEQQKWHAVFQDCVRHTNNGLSEECKVSTPAFTDSLRLYRQAKGHYGTWDMMCGNPAQILSNLVMETLHPELRNMIVPRLKGKLQQRQKDWMLISDAVYRQVLAQTRTQHEAMVQVCEVERPHLDAALRTDMDQIITSKEHVSGKIRAFVLPRAEQLLRSSVQPYINSILEALMEPTSRGFSEVRDILFRELVEVSKNTMNDSSKEKLGEHMDRISMLAFHPVKMQSCYEKMERLNLEGLQQRFDVSSPSVFIQRAQILMRQQMDNAVHTFEQLLHQSLDGNSGEDTCKILQRCQDRVLKKYDYDSSTVRKKFFREALLQIIIPYMLKQLSPSCSPDLPKFKELIFEDFSRFILVESIFEEVVLQSVTKDILMAVKEAAVQRRHNLYRDSMALTNSDPNLHLLGENTIDWAGQFGDVKGEKQRGDGANRKRRQIVSMIHLEGMPPLPYESCQEVPGVDGIPEENEGQVEQDLTAEKLPNSMENKGQVEQILAAEKSSNSMEDNGKVGQDLAAEKPSNSMENKGQVEQVLAAENSSNSMEDNGKVGQDLAAEKPSNSMENKGQVEKVLAAEKSSNSMEDNGKVGQDLAAEKPSNSKENKGLVRQVLAVEKSSNSMENNGQVGQDFAAEKPSNSMENKGQVGQDLEAETPIKVVEHVPFKEEPGSPDSIDKIRHLINPVQEVVVPASLEVGSQVTNGILPLEEGDEVKHITTVTETVQRQSPTKKEGPSDDGHTLKTNLSEEQQSLSAIESAIQQIEIAVQEDPTEHLSEGAVDSDEEFTQTLINSSPRHHDDSGFQSPANENAEGEAQPIMEGLNAVDAEQVTLTLVEGVKTASIDLDVKASCDVSDAGKESKIKTTEDGCLQ